MPEEVVVSTANPTTTANGGGGGGNSSKFLRMSSTPAAAAAAHGSTTTTTPATLVSHLLQGAVALPTALQSGLAVEKVTTRGQFYPRVVTISSDCLALFCTHTAITHNNKKKKKNDTTTTDDHDDDDDKGVPSSLAARLPLPFLSRKGIMGFTGSSLRDRYVRYLDVADLDAVATGTVTSRKLENTRGGDNHIRRKQHKVDTKSKHIVTIFHHGDQTLDIMVANEKEREAVVGSVQQMIDTYRQAALMCGPEALLLRYIWYDVDHNRDGTICESEFLKILGRINLSISKPKRVYRDFCRELSAKPSKGLKLDQIISLLQKIKRKEGNATIMLWQKIFGPEVKTVNAATLLNKFLLASQKEAAASLEDAHSIIQQINAMDIESRGVTFDGSDPYITFAQFEAFLYHDANAAYDPAARVPSTEPLNEPMSHYFINTSHNTYLTGDQLQSASSVEMYDRALRRGCKCLELDCWDGEAKPKKNTALHPVVFHGHTITSKILFGDILLVVKNYLKDFPETYPIILSLENHCSFPYQEALASLLTETFGETLFTPKSDMRADELLPSPESLRGRVVIKGKRPPEPDDVDEEDDYDPYGDPGTGGGDVIPRSKSGNPKSSSSSKPVKPPKVVKNLSRLTLFHGTKYKTFDQSLSAPASHMHSINELKILKILSQKTNGPLWRLYNNDHMTRTYPAGTRVDSSNYMPLLAWSMGCQMVALNFQTPDAALIVNDGFFRRNGGCGYIRKPACVLEGGANRRRPIMQISIRVWSGTCLPKPRGAKAGETIDPYVQVTLHDVSGMSAVQRSDSTKVVVDNGFCPVWKDAAFTFAVCEPDLAVVRFGLRESDITLDEDVAYAAIPVAHLRPGYRSVQLYDRNNTRTGPFQSAALLVEITTSRTVTAAAATAVDNDFSTSSRHA